MSISGNKVTEITFPMYLGATLYYVGPATCEYRKPHTTTWLVVGKSTIVGIGYPKFGYPRVIPEPESKFGYGLGWVCVQIPWVFLGWVPIKFNILGFFGYYPWVPKSIGYPKLGHLRVIPELYYDKKCSYKYY